MRRQVVCFAVTIAIALAGSNALRAQTAPASAPKMAAKPDTPPAPAPPRDLTGVWMRRTPQGAFGSGATYTKDLPEMTPAGQAIFKQAKNSNGGKYTLEDTNDPVLTRCYPPGVPRV